MSKIVQIVLPLIWAGLAVYNFLTGVPSLGIGFMVLYHLERHDARQ